MIAFLMPRTRCLTLFDRETNTMTTSSIGVLKIYRRDPDNVVTWEEAKAKILSKSALLEVVFLPVQKGTLQGAYSWVQEHTPGRTVTSPGLKRFPLLGQSLSWSISSLAYHTIPFWYFLCS